MFHKINIFEDKVVYIKVTLIHISCSTQGIKCTYLGIFFYIHKFFCLILSQKVDQRIWCKGKPVRLTELVYRGDHQGAFTCPN